MKKISITILGEGYKVVNLSSNLMKKWCILMEGLITKYRDKLLVESLWCGENCYL